jgi:pimeloyl-ACP methyl ester carboxylesterase
MEDAIWARAARPPAPHDVDTSFGPTRAYHWPGDGEPLVLLHGGLCTSVIWLPVIEALDRRDVWAVDIMGDVGRSEHRAPFTTEADFATWLDEALGALGLDAVRVGGHSLGGWVALNLAVHRPDRVVSLVLFDPGGVAPLNMTGLAKWGMPTMLGSLAPAAVRRRIARRTRNPMAEDKQMCRLILHGALRHRPGIPTRGLLTDDDLASMRPPMTLVVGERTEMFDSIAMRDRVRQLSPGARTELIEGAGHALIHSHVDRCVAALTAAQA